MRLTIFAAIATLVAAPVSAQQADALSTALASALSASGNYNEGDTIRSGSVAAPSVNSTAPCVIGRSGGLAVAGTGITYGGGTINRKCETRAEALILTEIADMPPAKQRAAIVHFCRNDEDMRGSMVDLGWCQQR